MKRLFLAAIAAAASTLACAQGVTDTQIVLGQSVALTGPAQQLGLDMQLGATLYFNKVNAQGGVHGRKIVLKTLDDGYEPPNAVAKKRSPHSPRRKSRSTTSSAIATRSGSKGSRTLSKTGIKTVK